MKIKVGIIGLGYWGKNILRNLHDIGGLELACDFSNDIINDHRKTYTDITFTTNPDEVFNNPKITAVFIATPAATHYEVAKTALKSGKNVFVEKPLSLCCDHGQELVDLARERNRVLMVGHVLQYHPAVNKLKELIEKGELGEIQYIYSNRLNLGKLRIEENIWWSFAPHDISVILWLLDEEPVRIESFGGNYLTPGVKDVTLTLLGFENGVKAHIFVSWLHPFKEQKLVVVGSKKMAVFDDLTEEKLFIYPHEIKCEEGKIPIVNKADYYCVDIDKKEPLREEILHFLHCVNTREKPRTDGEEGLKVLAVLEEAEKNYGCAK